MRGQTCFALFEDNRTILVFFIVTQRDGRIESYAPVARSLFPRARQCNCSRRSHVGIVACRGYVGSQLRSAPPCSYSFCTGRGCRFVNVFSYNGFLLPHVRRRHDFLSRFQPYTSFDRNQPSAFFFASPLKPGTVFDATLLLLRLAVPGFSFHQQRFSFRNSGVFWEGRERARVEPLFSSCFFLWVTLLLFALLSILEIFSLLGFHAFPWLFAYSILPKFLLSSLTRIFLHPPFRQI